MAMSKKDKDVHIAQIAGYQRNLKFHLDYFAKTDESSISLEGYQCRLESLLPLFDNYQTYFTPLYPNIDVAEQPTYEHEANEFASDYFNLIAKIHEKIREKKNEMTAAAPVTHSQPVQSSGASVRTPKIELPTFDGSSDQWIKFRDMFESLIHTKTNLSNVEKFSYLQSSIKLPVGQSSVLDNFKVCEDDYVAAWQAVCDRYNDKRKIIAMHCATIFSVKKMSCESASELRRIIDSFSSQLSALKQLGYALGDHDDFANMIVVQFVLVRLDEYTLREWKKFHTADCASWKQLSEFLTAQWRSLDDVQIRNVSADNEVKVQAKPMKALVATNSNNSYNRSSSVKCAICFDSHFLWACPKFNSMSVEERQKTVRDKRLCLNCFSPAHQVRACPSKYRCKTCNQPHHTLLHYDRSITSSTNSSNGQGSASSASSLSADSKPFQPFVMTKKSSDGATSSKMSSVALTSSEAYHPKWRNTFLSTVSIEVVDANGNIHEVRALLDTGSDDNLMTTHLARRLGTDCTPVCIPLTGIGEKTSIVHHQTSALISSRYGPFQRTLEFSVLSSITSNVPSQSIDTSKFTIPDECFLADPKYNVSAKVDMLLNIDIFYEALLEGKISLKDGPKMLHTTFGWIIGGSTATFSRTTPKTLLSCFAHQAHGMRREGDDDQLTTLVGKFAGAEEVDVPKRILTAEEQYCEDLFVEKTTRGSDGKLTLYMPVKENIAQLGRNLKNATQMVYAQEAMRKKNEVVNKHYVEAMQDFEESGHMEEVVPDPVEFAHYLPLHGVVKMSSSTTKVRPVGNASSKTETGISLNDTLCVGPIVQPELFDILLRFREKPYVLIGDLSKMYRQIWVHPSQRKYLRLMWRANPESEPIKHYQFNTVTFGTACASFLATRAVKQLGIENEEKFPRASAIIQNSIYVDDLLAGFDTIEEGKKVRDHLRYIFASAGMKLCKMSANSPELLVGLPEKDIEAKPDEENNIVKALGIDFELSSDQVAYREKLQNDGPITKVQVLSDIAKFYDPIGWINPSVVKLKIFMKKLWTNKLGWKDLLSDQDRQEWIELRESFPFLRNIKIKRHCILPSAVNVELHGFCDASIEAYGACVYLRSTDEEGKVQVSLICAKSKVAPMKQQSLARLELCGALLLAKLVHRVLGILETSIDDVTLWCDSTIVLNWITMLSSKLHTYVGNRVALIQLLVGKYRMRHINGHLNPGDIISRGMSLQELVSCSLWWDGPAFLKLPKSEWPESIITINEDDPEVKQEMKKSLVINRESTMFEYIEMRHSKTRTLFNVIAFLQRFRNNMKFA